MYRRRRTLTFSLLLLGVAGFWLFSALRPSATTGSAIVPPLASVATAPATASTPSLVGAPDLPAPTNTLELWALSAPSPAASASIARLNAYDLSALRTGNRVRLPLTADKTVLGLINTTQVNASGALLLGGSIEGAPRAAFSMEVTASGLTGRILFPDTELAWLITPHSAQHIAINQIPLGTVICTPYSPPLLSALAASASQTTVHTADEAPPILSSRPSATAVLYLDFDGATVTDPAWNAGNPVTVAASNFTTSEITEIWKHVSEDFSPFNIDVTTDPARYDSAPVGRRSRCILTPTYAWYGTPSGVAYTGSFSTAGSFYSDTIPCWVFIQSTHYAACAVSHEFGHTLGLHHCGRSIPGGANEEYYSGHGSGNVSWSPIMGTSYYTNLTQWSKGEYLNANNLTDAVNTITYSNNGFGYAPDEAGDTRFSAAPLTLSGAQFTQKGVISSATDTDFFTVTVGQGNLTINATPAEFSPNLDILLELQNSSGTTLGTINPDSLLTASLTTTVAAGTYYIKISGTGRGNPLVDGYTNYGCIGQYTLVVDAVTPLTFSTPLRSEQTVTAGKATTLSAIVFGAPEPTYKWQLSTDSGTTWSDVAASSTYSGTTTARLTLTSTPLSLNGTRYRLMATNANGSITSTSLVLTVANVQFPEPSGITVDSAGNLYIADSTLHTIQKVTTANLASTFAGSPNQTGSTDATGTSARFLQPTGLALDSTGNLYVADRGNHTVRMISTTGAVTTFAGSAGSAGSTDGAASTARFKLPTALCFDSLGNLYVTDTGNYTVRMITSAGQVSTIAGQAASPGTADGTGSSARFSSPSGITCDSTNTLYVTDKTSHTIRKISGTGTAASRTVMTHAGTANALGTDDGTGIFALFNQPSGIIADSSGNVFIADTANSSLRKITSAGFTSTFAGLSGISSVNGIADGTGSAAWFAQPLSLTRTTTGDLYVADTGNAAIRKITSAAVVTTLAITADTSTGGGGGTGGGTGGATTGGGGGGGGSLGLQFSLTLALLLTLRFRRSHS